MPQRNPLRWLMVMFICATVSLATTPQDDVTVSGHYRLTIYQENLLMLGAVWANPAAAASVTTPLLLASHATPVSLDKIVSTIRLLLPYRGRHCLSVGISGAGNSQSGSFSVSNDGASFAGHFVFSRPALQLGAATQLPSVGAIGIQLLGGAGEEYLLGKNHYYPIGGIIIGWQGLPLLKPLQISAAMHSSMHRALYPFWEHEAKLGMQLTLLDSTLLGTAEYGFLLTDNMYGVNVFKAQLSARMLPPFGLLLGFSTDFADIHTSRFNDDGRRLGPMLHGGIEILTNATTPFLGGYEVGVPLDGSLQFSHRFWIGYKLRNFLDAPH